MVLYVCKCGETSNLTMNKAENLNEQISIRHYHKRAHAAVLNLMDLNTPKFFAKEEQEAFKSFLENEIDHYFVIENKTEILGCGGFNRSEVGNLAYISWDMVHPDFQGLSIGTQLLMYRLKILQAFGNIETIVVRTSQLTYPFYEKRGFKCLEIQKDFWAPGFDMVVMRWEGTK